MNEDHEKGPWVEVKRRRWDVIKPPRDITGPWIEVKKTKMKEKKRQWDALPSTALLNIFCKSEPKDRLKSIPLVCKSWKYVTDNPRCWSSMIPDSVSPEDAFIKNTSGYKFESHQLSESFEREYYESKLVKETVYDYLIGISRLFKEEGDDHQVEEEFKEVHVGVLRLRTLIKKSGGGAAITTLYLSPFNPFRSWGYWQFVGGQFEKILHLIANCCPNLKHISLGKMYYQAFIEARLYLFNKCKKLELVDLYLRSGYNDDLETLVIQDIGKCLPNLRGIRIRKCLLRAATVSIATYLPQLKLLSLTTCYSLCDEHLSTILFSCLGLQYLYAKGCRYGVFSFQNIINQASAQNIPEFYFVRRYDGLESMEHMPLRKETYIDGLESMEHMLKRKETDIADDVYLYILKQRKEDQYVSILKKDRNVSIFKKKVKYYHILKKKQRDQCNSRLKKKKKKYQYDSTLRKMKKDQCDYADYDVIH